MSEIVPIKHTDSAVAMSGLTDQGGGKPRVLHLTGDFPDPIDSFKTPVVRTLVDLTGDRLDNSVFSLNRRSPQLVSFVKDLLGNGGRPDLKICDEPFAYGRALTYEAPPRGIFHETMLDRLGDWLAEQLSGTNRYEILIGHKLTIEGLVVRRAAQLLGLPFGICIQGDTDTKVLRARPDLARKIGRVFREAAVVFPFTPWALAAFEKRFERRSLPTVMLPCPTDLDTPQQPRTDGDGFVTVFHLKNHRRKNLQGMLAALRLLENECSDVRLEIVGGGTDEDFERCRLAAQGLRNLTFAGSMDREQLQSRLNRATGLVLPSLRESFGLVFIEALFAGLPIIYPKGTAIDGYFDGYSFALGVDAKDPSEIAAAMKQLVGTEVSAKADLLRWQQSTEANRFLRISIADTFAGGIFDALSHDVPVRRG